MNKKRPNRFSTLSEKKPNRLSTVSRKTQPICRKQQRQTVSTQSLNISKNDLPFIENTYSFYESTGEKGFWKCVWATNRFSETEINATLVQILQTKQLSLSQLQKICIWAFLVMKEWLNPWFSSALAEAVIKWLKDLDTFWNRRP